VELIYQIADIAPMVVAICSIIAAATPTPKDDALMAQLYSIIDVLAINVGKAKQ